MALYPNTRRTLLEKIKTGDQISWNEFYDRYSPVIRIIGLKSGIRQNDIEDLVQEVMQSFFKSVDHFCYDPAKARFRTYFNRIIRSRICDIFRRQDESATDLQNDDKDNSFEIIFDEQWRALILNEALSALKERVKPQTYLAYTLTEYEMWETKRAAEFLGISENSVYIGRKRCQEFLKKKIIELSDGDPVF